MLHDPATNRFFDPDKIHKINHVGKRYRVEGPHIVEPSPQRSPVFFQAGNSDAGRRFAARNAEVTFLPSQTPDTARKDIAILNRELVNYGRQPEDLKKLVSLSTVIGSTEEEAKRKQQHLFDNIDINALQGFYSGGSGIDLSSIDPDTPLTELSRQEQFSQHMRSKFRIAVDADYGQGRVLTWREYLLQHALLPGRFAGTPEQIADKVQQYADAGVNGFNVVPVTTLGWWDEWVEHVVPVLQKRGLARKEYRPGTLREKIFGKESQLPATHPQRKLKLE